MTTSMQARDTVFPGYLLTERIGSGGYAEVWRARAPGGIDKAIKIVYGCCSDQFATQEMKAMERIKGVRHPFVLSLERFEVIDGRLAILTELADMSLEQRAQQCRAQGLPGIPRSELLAFMSDTAEALDYLAERHSLQHLDIKPANLLISGDHVKVADFGLVKELATRTQNSMVAGMTPTYSSPEMFDDAPSPQSDQYSLAIVYQEMLTGVLPFPGRTAAQLANQHLRSQPQLTPLVESDRKAVARALAKNPAERFSSCRAFVKALIESIDPPAARATTNNTKEKFANLGHDVSDVPTTKKPAVNRAIPSHPSPGDAKTQPTEVRSHGSVDTKVEQKRSAKVQPEESIVDIGLPDVASADGTMQPTLYIAVGGVGIRILSRLRDLLARRAAASQQSSPVEAIAIDTDRAELQAARSKNWVDPLPSSDTLFLSLRLPQQYRDRGPDNLEWLSHRWLYNIPRSLETRGYRPLGRLALVDHVDKVLSLIDRKLEQLVAFRSDNGDRKQPTEIRVVLLAGMGGGTGGGMAIDLANAARSRIQGLGHRAQLHAVFVCTCLENTSASQLSVANTYALLTELEFVSAFGNQGARSDSTKLQQLESHNRPFDLVYCVTTQHRGNEQVDDDLGLIANHLALASSEKVRQTLQACQKTATPRELTRQEPVLLRTFGSAVLAGEKQNRIDCLARHLAEAMEKQWLANVCPNESLQYSAAESASVKAQAEQWRQRFGAYGSSRFAYEAVSRIYRQSALCDAYRTVLLSSTNPAKYGELASQMISSLGKRVADSANLDDLPSGEGEIITGALNLHSNTVLAKLIDHIAQIPVDSPFDVAKADRILMTECATVIKECLDQQLNGPTVDSNSAMQADACRALDEASVDLLKCGCDRRTLIVVPSSDQTSEAIAAVTKARPTAAIVSADVDHSVIFCEGSGISPSSLARGFERVYPGVAEAASRLFTRIDIDWSAGS